MVGHLMEGQARRAEHFVARITALGMRLADGSVTVAASLGSIISAGITGCVLDTGNFDHRALHSLTPEVAHSTCFHVNGKADIIRPASSMKAKKKPAKNSVTPQPKMPPTASPTTLKGWQQISAFLSQPVSVAQRWAKDGMPLKRQGRFMTATPEDLNKWLGREVGGEPVQVATADLDLSKELKRGLAFVRRQKKR